MKHPSPVEIRALRTGAGLSQREAAELVHSTWSAWQRWESGKRRMHPALWELAQIKIKRQSDAS